MHERCVDENEKKNCILWLNENANDLNEICMAFVVCQRNRQKLSPRKNILAMKTE